tara:strand:- start:1084 stop:1773 length:690 start_codon:yes stop_codon:yes gene_type:complete
MVRSSTLNTALQGQQTNTFKTMNNLLTLQDNHVEEFLQYHGHDFFLGIEKFLEDIVERVMSQMLSKLEFNVDNTSGTMRLNEYCLKEYERITQENIELDIQAILGASLNMEVINQRRLAKNSYLESQGFNPQSPASPAGQGMPANQGMVQGQIQGQPMGGQMNQQMAMQQNNQSGYPVPPAGYDNYGNPYWVDPNTGQVTYTAPTSGLGIGRAALQGIGKAAAWAKWLA